MMLLDPGTSDWSQTEGWEDTRPSAWLTGPGLQLEVPEDTLPLLNMLGTGYYRVNYDVETWGRIGRLLATDHQALHPLQRMVLICDLLALTESGHVPEEVMRQVLDYGSKEEDYGPNLAFFVCSGHGRSAYRQEDKQVV